MNRIRFLFFLLFYGFSVQVSAQAPIAEFKKNSLEQGLSQRTGYTIAQDHQGFLWFGTQDGLNRYDGYQFKVYKNNPSDSTSLSDNRVRIVYVDRKETLWVGTSNGLNRYDPRTDSFTRFFHDPGDPNSLSDNDIRAIYQDREGIFWIGTNNGGLNSLKINETTALTSGAIKIERHSHDPNDRKSIGNNIVLAIQEDLDGNIWVGTLGGGLNKFHRKSGTFTRFEHDPRNPNSLSSNFVMALYMTKSGMLWVGTYGGGLVKFDPENEKFVQFKHDPNDPTSLSSDRILSLFQDRTGTLWIGTLGGGLCKLVTAAHPSNGNPDDDNVKSLSNQVNATFVCYKNNPSDPKSLGDNIIRAIYEDRSRNLWIGTNLSGINKLDLKPPKFKHVKHEAHAANSLVENHVNAILKDRHGTLWVGTNNILNKYENDLEGFKHFAITPGRASRAQGYIFALCEARNDYVWVGTYGEGLFKFDRKSEKFTQFKHEPENPSSLSNNRVTALIEDRFGYIWVGTANGLNRFDPRKERFRSYYYDANQEQSLSNNEVLTLYEDRSGNIWIGTGGGGLSLFDWESETFHNFKNDPTDLNSLSNNYIHTIYEDQNNNLWVGTGNGLNKLNPNTGEAQHYFESDGLPNSYISGILGDKDGNLWIATNRGLSRFNPDDSPENRIRNYALNHGLQGLEFYEGASHLADDGEMFFGGSNGFNRFYPEDVKDNPYIPPIVITAFKKFGKDITYSSFVNNQSEIDLSYKENFFSIEFAALDFSYPERNRYAYMLEGLDKDWIYAGSRRFVNYSNLDPGNYIFRVKGSNSDGFWNEEGTSIKITITPPFWQTWWFRILAGLVTVGLLALAYNYRVSKLLEIERTRNRIAQDLHDEVGATLSSISYFAQAIRSESEAQGVPISKKFLSLISESSSEAQEAISDIIWAIDPANDNWEKLFAKFRRYASDLFDSQSIRYDIRIPESLSINTLDMEQRRNFWLVYKEMVTNVAKHSRCSKAQIRISVEGKLLTLHIEDDGTGFDPNLPTERNGIRNIHARAKNLNAQIALETKENAGTQWDLKFPI